MNFLEKIEDAINALLISLFEKIKAILPHWFFEITPFMQSFKSILAHFFSEKKEALKNKLVSFLAESKESLAFFLGYITAFSIYLRSEEFKKNKFSLISKPYRYCLSRPKYTAIAIFALLFTSLSTYQIFQSMNHIIIGSKKMRAPASAHSNDGLNEQSIELKDRKFEVAMKAGGGHGAASGHHEVELHLDLILDASSSANKELLEEMEEKLDVELEAFDFSVSALPMSDEEKKNNEKALLEYLNHEFSHMAHGNILTNLSIKHSPQKRPVYFKQEDRTYSMKDVTLQIFLEDTKRNKQVSFDYSLLTSNRNVVLYLRDHEEKVRDRFSTQIEPIIPQLPIEAEGRSIIKDKIRYELNELLKEEKIEGKILEVYIDYILGS